MQTIRISDDLLQFNHFVEPIDLTFNQYLLLGAEPLLVHTGMVEHTQELLPHLEEALAGRDLAYVFASHFEGDECGGFSLVRERYPAVRLFCSEVTERELAGFGVAADCLLQQPGDALETADARLEFLAYPSEVHLWEGLLLFERRRGVLFSSDLFSPFGRVEGGPVAGEWRELVATIPPEDIPSPDALRATQEVLAGLPVALVAPGHGPCVKV